MKIFRSIREMFERMGIHPVQPFESDQSFNSRNLFFGCGACLFLVSSVLYLLRVAETTKEYSLSSYTISTCIMAVSSVPILMWKSPTIFKLIAGLEGFIESRKC